MDLCGTRGKCQGKPCNQAPRHLPTDSGCIFVQIGDENVHRVRGLLDEVFGDRNHIIEIKFRTTSNRTADFLPSIFDTIIAYAKDTSACKIRRPFKSKEYADVSDDSYGCIEIDTFEWRRLTQTESVTLASHILSD
jgi:adenine-specific DNA-methyltransferase